MKRYTLKRKNELSSEKGSIDYQGELNQAQYEVVTTLEGPVLVIAGAGSGKTRTLVYRVARLVDMGVAPESILLLTFTRRAAQEMIQRASLLMDSRCERVFGGTFHSVANLLLREYGGSIGVSPEFTIMDRSDSDDAINLLRAQAGLHEKAKRFPKKKTLGEIFSKSVNKMISIEQMVEEGYDHFWANLSEIELLFDQYQSYKLKNRVLDFDDLLVQFRCLLEKDESARVSLWKRFHYIMVDEYQDTNRIQGDIISFLGGPKKNIMVVGDDSQSIYSFRGACFRNIMDFPQQFPGTRVLTLEENYRSTQPILNLTNQIISRASEGHDKQLYTRRENGEIPVLVQAPTEREQSQFIRQKILELREEGVPLHEMAVLFRSSFQSFDLEMELTRSEVPFDKRGGFKFLDTLHIKDILAHLRVMVNPMDTVSWNRILLLVEGIGPKKSQKILERLSGIVRPREIFQSLETISEDLEIRKTLRDFLYLFKQVSVDWMTPGELLEKIYEYYIPILKQRHDDYPKRLRDLEHLYTIGERYGKLFEFLSDVILDPSDESVSGVVPETRDKERMILSTIHSAKGLEWDTVFIIWLLDGKFPSHYSFVSDEDLEEERRLLYVAATRAKKRLFLSYPINIYDKIRGTVLSKPSYFIDEISEEILEQWIMDEAF